MGIEKSGPKESVDAPKVHGIPAFENAIKNFDREQLLRSDPLFIAAVSVSAIAHYIHQGKKLHIDDTTPSKAEENTLVDAWNAILAYVDTSAGRISARDARQDERAEHPRWTNADPHLYDYQLVVPNESDAEMFDVLLFDFLYEIFRGKKSFVDFVAGELKSMKLTTSSRIYELSKDKSWWSDDYLSEENAADV